MKICKRKEKDQKRQEDLTKMNAEQQSCQAQRTVIKDETFEITSPLQNWLQISGYPFQYLGEVLVASMNWVWILNLAKSNCSHHAIQNLNLLS